MLGELAAAGGITLYFFPSLFAYATKHANRGAVLFTNIATGWTIAGWFLAMVWAIQSE